MSTPTETEQEKAHLTPEQLDAIMPAGQMVHTFMEAGNMLLGAEWERQKLLKEAKENGAELAGEQATALKHGAVVWIMRGTNRIPVFVATKEEAQ